MFLTEPVGYLANHELVSIEDAPGNLEYVTASHMDALGITFV